MIRVFSYPLGERSFHLFFDLKQAIVSVSGRLSPHNFEMFSISPLQAYLFRCWFSNNSIITFLEGCFPSSFVAEVGIFSSILLFQWSIFYSFFRRHCDVALFTHHLDCEDRVLFVLILLSGVLCYHFFPIVAQFRLNFEKFPISPLQGYSFIVGFPSTPL